jgi:hypothetical protein
MEVELSLVEVEVFLVEVELFLVEVELFLVEVEVFLVEVELFLVEVESFLVEDESFLVEQFRKNSSFNAGIKQSPYATLFGIKARIGLTSSPLPHDVIQKLQTEDDLLAILSSSSTQPDTQPLPEMTPPLPETTQPLPEMTQPLPETTQLLPETPQPLPETTQPLPETTQSLSETTQPLPETTQPTSSIDKNRKLAIAAKHKQAERVVNKGNNKITELRTILQRESQNS